VRAAEGTEQYKPGGARYRRAMAVRGCRVRAGAASGAAVAFIRAATADPGPARARGCEV
jgi:hypothetical protein